jgi:hypothetical protein
MGHLRGIQIILKKPDGSNRQVTANYRNIGAK